MNFHFVCSSNIWTFMLLFKQVDKVAQNLENTKKNCNIWNTDMSNGLWQAC